MRRRRQLSDEERALWDHVTRQVEPLHKRPPPPAPPAPPPLPDPAKNLAKATAKNLANRPAPDFTLPPAEHFRVGAKADPARGHDLLPSISDMLGRAAVRMDAKTHGKMKKGKLIPEGRIDLHGMTVAEAHPALLSFILSSHANGRRLVLVITGKGKIKEDLAPMPIRQGVLRHQVPHWLALPPLAQVVLQVTPAHITHGGGGAYYVYLRRTR